MVRTPDGSEPRVQTLQVRVTPTMASDLDGQRAFRGGMSRSTYIRWLVAQDGKRIARERGK